MLKGMGIELRSLEVLAAIDEPLDCSDDEDEEECYYTVVYRGC
jgi:hypothetical protein